MPSTLEHGHCFVCGTVGDFVNLEDKPTRENHRCGDCNASLRYRHQAEVLLAIYGKNKSSLTELVKDESFGSLAIYEPGIIGPLRKLLRHLPRYVHSYYWQNVEPGEIHDDVRCEDLQHLTFRDELFDLVISSDIFEHVRGPWEGFAEVFRVLRPGGSHVFTVPVSWPLVGQTIARVDTSGPADIHVLPPQYHGSPTDPEGSLVYTDFGLDLPDRLRELGFDTCVYHGYRHNLTFVSTRPRRQRRLG